MDDPAHHKRRSLVSKDSHRAGSPSTRTGYARSATRSSTPCASAVGRFRPRHRRAAAADRHRRPAGVLPETGRTCCAGARTCWPARRAGRGRDRPGDGGARRLRRVRPAVVAERKARRRRPDQHPGARRDRRRADDDEEIISETLLILVVVTRPPGTSSPAGSSSCCAPGALGAAAGASGGITGPSRRCSAGCLRSRTCAHPDPRHRALRSAAVRRDQALLLYESANYDETHFRDPATFDPARDPTTTSPSDWVRTSASVPAWPAGAAGAARAAARPRPDLQLAADGPLAAAQLLHQRHRAHAVTSRRPRRSPARHR